MWWRCAVLPSLPWVVCFLSFFLGLGCPDHLQAKRDGKGEVAMEEVERGRVVRVEMEDVASGFGVDTDRSLHASEGTG